MNKNTVIGTILMVLLLFGWVWYNQPSPEQIEAQRRYNDSIAQAQAAAANAQLAAADEARLTTADDEAAPTQAEADSIADVRRRQRYGNLAAAAVAPAADTADGATAQTEYVTLSNERLTVDIDVHGGMPARAVLREFADFEGQPLTLFAPDNNSASLTFYSIGGKYVTTKDLYFTPVAVSDTSATMRLRSDDGAIMDLVYTLPRGSYVLGFDIHTLNFDAIVSPTQPTLTLSWQQRLPRTELGRKFEERYSDLRYKYAGDGPDYLKNMSADDERISSGRMAWVGFHNQFFSSAIIGDNLFRAGSIASTPLKEEQDADHVKLYEAELEFDVELAGNQMTQLAWYLGPNDYWLLSDVDAEVAARLGMKEKDLRLQKLVDLGPAWLAWVNRFITVPVFHFFSSFISNYGIIILLLTLVIKLIIFPFTRKSMVSAAKMRIFQQLPEAKAINEKYPNQEDAMEKQQAMMALMSKAGVSQMGGCLPMLLQFPVLLALFYFFPNSIELRGESFLWAKDLSTYDSIFSWDAQIPLVSWIFDNHISLFCLLMTATNILYTYINMKQNPSQQSMPGMKMMMYVMPLMFFAILNNYSAGLSYYYFLSTLISIAQTYIIRASMDEEKILATMKANLKKPGKTSKAGGWLAKMQELQRQQQAEMKRQREEQLRRQRR